MKSLLIYALAAAALPGFARADNDASCTNEPRSAWMTPEQAALKLQQDGYFDRASKRQGAVMRSTPSRQSTSAPMST
ncbi:hypothetical protein J2Z31_001071 [Sinorhizobium kostiense]|uniref:PepSY domain-containing protein n=1 Tax=Sinorhizobium kostiense TaxID=76747 RepID=A0ABS4QWS5_9HYPH|nr:hypothetical protein [Sinorhizobium kostiense]